MPLIGGSRVALALEDVAKMAAAVRADDLCPRHAVATVVSSRDSAGDAVEVCRPAAAGLEFVACLVQRRITTGASVDALLWEVLVVLARIGGFGSLLTKDTELLCFMLAVWLQAGRLLPMLRLPFDRTARHSSSVRWSGNDMALEVLLEEKSELRNGMVGIDFGDALTGEERSGRRWSVRFKAANAVDLEELGRLRMSLVNLIGSLGVTHQLARVLYLARDHRGRSSLNSARD